MRILCKRKLLFICSFFIVAVFFICESCTKKLAGSVSASGTVTDAFDGLPVANVDLVLGRKGPNGFGGVSNSVYILTDPVTTDANGAFSVQHLVEDETVACLCILNSDKIGNTALKNRYSVKSLGTLSMEIGKNCFATARLKELTNNGIAIVLYRKGYLKLNVFKNPFYTTDTITINNLSKIISSDTVFYFIVEPDYTNGFELKRKNQVVWKDSIYTGIKGDTTIRNVQL